MKIFWIRCICQLQQNILSLMTWLNHHSLDVEFESQTRWKIEEFNREIKQLTGWGFCQCRLRIIQKNHIVCAMLVWNFFKRFATKIGKSIYQVKHELLSKYLTDQLKNPSIKMKVIWLEKLKVFWVKIVRRLLTQSSANAHDYSEVRRSCHALYIVSLRKSWLNRKRSTGRR